MKLDLQSLFGLHVLSCTVWLRPRNPPPPPPLPAFGLIYEGAISQWSAKMHGRHLFVTPGQNTTNLDYITIPYTLEESD
jgi:hypothetical protein